MQINYKKTSARLMTLILASLLLAGCSKTTRPDDPDTKIVAPSDTKPTSDLDKNNTTKPETSVETDSPVTAAPPETTSSPETSGTTGATEDDTFPGFPETTLPADTIAPVTIATYRYQFVTSSATYYVDADYNLGISSGNNAPVFYSGKMTEIELSDGKYMSVYSPDLNVSLVINPDGAPINVITGRIVNPADGHIITYTSENEFRMLNKNFAYASDETFRGWNEREDGCLALFHGKGDIWISDGNQIIDKKTFDLIYYFADIYLLVRENDHLMMYNTNFEMLEDYGEISLSNKFHFDETVREGKKRNHFTFHFDKGTFRYDPPEEETENIAGNS